jgi:hypothetical protein
MNLLRTTIAVAAAALLSSASPARAGASPNASPASASAEPTAPTARARASAAAAASPYHLDLETDPTAFVFRGYSLHAGLGYGHLRLDLGGYAMDLPSFFRFL